MRSLSLGGEIAAKRHLNSFQQRTGEKIQTPGWSIYLCTHYQIPLAEGNLGICLANMLLLFFLTPQSFLGVEGGVCSTLWFRGSTKMSEGRTSGQDGLSNILQQVVGVTHPCPPRTTLHHSQNQVRGEEFMRNFQEQQVSYWKAE